MNDEPVEHEVTLGLATSIALAILLLLVTVALWGCGGGGNGPSVTGPITPPPTLRSDLLVGYFGDCDTCAAETADHTNLYFAFGFNALDRGDSIRRGRAAGFTRFVLGLWEAQAGEEPTRATLRRLDSAGALAGVEALYWIDEPHLTDAQMTATNAMLRRVAAEFPALRGVKLAVIYDSNRPGIASFDWVGFDDYNAGCGVVGDAHQALKASLRADQRILLVPGGADPWRQDPACFAARAHADPQVVAVVPFIWYDNADRGVGAGIRSNPTRRLYCEMGRTMTGRDPRC